MELHDYQKYAVRFIEEHPIAALFLDMGLGKTITTLTAIHNLMFDLFTVRKVLIIARCELHGIHGLLKLKNGST